MVGGTQVAFGRARPLFEAMGKNITLVGEESGAGQTSKVANRIVLALTIQAVAEALVFAAKASADPAKVWQALMGGLATSRVLELRGERITARKFDPGFRIRLHQKDLHLALPNTALPWQLFFRLRRCGRRQLGPFGVGAGTLHHGRQGRARRRAEVVTYNIT